MEIEEGGSPYSSIRNNAFWHNAHLDTELTVTREAMDSTLAHLDDCIENPTRGLLARREKRRNRPYYSKYYENEQRLFNFKEVKAKNDIFVSQFKELYPQTGKTRLNLIENKSIVLSSVKPKMTKLQKLMFKLFKF